MPLTFLCAVIRPSNPAWWKAAYQCEMEVYIEQIYVYVSIFHQDLLQKA